MRRAELPLCVLHFLPRADPEIAEALLDLCLRDDGELPVIDRKVKGWSLLAYVVRHGTDRDKRNPYRDDYELVEFLLARGARTGLFNVRNRTLYEFVFGGSRWGNKGRLWALLFAYGELQWGAPRGFEMCPADLSAPAGQRRYVARLLKVAKSRIILRALLAAGFDPGVILELGGKNYITRILDVIRAPELRFARWYAQAREDRRAQIRM